jgi:hypothetical protein
MGFLFLLLEALVAAIGLWCVGRVFPPTKPYVKKMNRKMWGHVKKTARQRSRARRKAREAEKAKHRRPAVTTPRRPAIAARTVKPVTRARIPSQTRRSAGACGAPLTSRDGRCMNPKRPGKDSCWIPSHG